MGTYAGYIRVHPLHSTHDLSDVSSYWALPMHDNQLGIVNHLSLSFDDQFLLSGGADGNLFVFKVDLPSAKEKKSAQVVEVWKRGIIVAWAPDSTGVFQQAEP